MRAVCHGLNRWPCIAGGQLEPERTHASLACPRRTALPASAGPRRPQIAQFAAELERYPQAIKIYEEVARACVDNNLLKYR